MADYYEGDLVIFMDWTGEAPPPGAIAEALCAQMEHAGLEAVLTICQELPTTADVRRAYLTIQGALPDAGRIWPGRRRFTLQEMAFAQSCRETLERGEAAVQQSLAPIQPVRRGKEGAELARTLQVYLLDTEGSVAHTAERLFLHKNTVKYRMQQIRGRLGYPADKLPESFGLYTACALERLLNL